MVFLKRVTKSRLSLNLWSLNQDSTVLGKFWIVKCSFFSIFYAFFINSWSRENLTWLWIQRSSLQISIRHFLFHKKNFWCHRDLNSQSPNLKSATLPLDHGDRFFYAKEFCMHFYLVGDVTTTAHRESVGKWPIRIRVNKYATYS